MGRPTKFKDEYCEQARKLCLLGYVDKQLADFFEVDEATLNRWKISHSKFCESLKAGKDKADADVVESLYKKATGYDITEKFVDKNGDVVELVKHIEPNVTAQAYWLNNRVKRSWKNRHSVDAKVEDTTKVDKQLIEGRQNLRKKMQESNENRDKD